MDKAAVFIDGGYVSVITRDAHSGEAGKPRKIDFAALAEKLAKEQGCELLRTYYYHCPPYQSAYPTEDERRRKQNHDRFSHSLKQLKRFQVREGRLARTFDEQARLKFVQKGVDVLLAIDMLKLVLKGAVQRVIMIACDSDFVPVVRAIKEEGTIVQLFHYDEGLEEHRASRFLIEEVDETFALSKKHLEDSTRKEDEQPRGKEQSSSSGNL